jgi:hypothetical protein
MPKEKKVNFLKSIKHWFTWHPWMKLIALIIAVMVWFYVQGEIGQFNF